MLINNGGQGLQLQDTTNVVVRDVLVAHNPTGVFLDDAAATFTGLLLVGNTNMDCAVTPAASGLTAACANEAASDASLSTGQTAASSFVAKVVTDDMVNLSDTNGTALAGMSDVTHFENLGAYQGHGDVEAVTFTDGAITGVELLRLSINGSP